MSSTLAGHAGPPRRCLHAGCSRRNRFSSAGAEHRPDITLSCTPCAAIAFGSNVTSFTVQENEVTGTAVGTVQLAEGHAVDVEYSFVSGDTAAFAVGLETAAITTAAVFDREVKSSYSVVLRAEKPTTGESTTTTVVVAVTDVNDNDPVITGGPELSVELQENIQV